MKTDPSFSASSREWLTDENSDEYISWKVEGDVDPETGKRRWLQGTVKLGSTEGTMYLSTYLYGTDFFEDNPERDEEEYDEHLDAVNTLIHELQAYRSTLRLARQEQSAARAAVLEKKFAALEKDDETDKVKE